MRVEHGCTDCDPNITSDRSPDLFANHAAPDRYAELGPHVVSGCRSKHSKHNWH